MTDEPDDIELDLLRERLPMLAERGEITGKKAEATAAAFGLEPVERKPELPRFDPKLKTHWSILMVVAWIAWRDFELVRKQDPEFCSACFHWVGRVRKVVPQNDGEPVTRMVYSLEARRAPTVERLSLLDELLRDGAKVSSNAVMRIREAVAALWQALSEGHLVALGFDAQGTVVEIPSREWVYLQLREEGGRDVLSYEAEGQPEPFTGLKFLQSDVLRLWPVTGELPEHDRADIATKAQKPRRQIDRTKWALGKKFPNGVPPDLTGKAVRRAIEPTFKKNSWKLPSVDTIARARGRGQR
ncbi:hypothetical protein [Bradyrhizobium sp. McL0616]|uniref:hypothetical protein n=1 Tax=Bradyrhizobium sp. McL0616 TaxID=3415674 RepID=UPI003CEF98CC